MPHDPRVDAYIEGTAPFARPILAHLRGVVHAACPGVEETIKWGRPFFTLDGRPLAFVAAFKAHAALGFWQGGAMGETGREAEAAGQFGRITTLADLPPDQTITEHLRKAADASKAPAPPRLPPRRPPAIPPDLAEALELDAEARAAFGRLPPSHQREHVAAITGAKKPETRARRLGRTLEKLRG